MGRIHGLLLIIGFLKPTLISQKPGDLIVHRALAYDGVEEVGSNWGPEVSYFLKQVEIDFPAPWCGAFAYAIRKEVGYEPTGKPRQYAWVPSWANAGKVVWKRSSNKKPYRHQVRPGDVILLWYPSLKRLGHIGTVIQVRKDGVVTSEGNTNRAGSREGQGVGQHFRSWDVIHTIMRPS
jgi:hypothetical protein